jgi:hypothetical protein
MRTTVLSALAALALAACTMAEPVDASAQGPVAEAAPAGSAAAETEVRCPVLVRFGSYASGIDTPAADAVEKALRADVRAASVTLLPWGREGERDLCVTPRAADDGRALVKLARGAVPDRKLNGYVDIMLDGKRVFTTQSSG